MAGSHTGHRTYRRNRDRLKRTAGTVCHWCGQAIDPTLDHLDPMAFQADHDVPYSKGGTHHISNLRAFHRKCNIEKGNKTSNPANDTRRCRNW